MNSQMKIRQKQVFGNQNTSSVLNVKNDDLLLKICDWNPFEEKVMSNPKFELPQFFINSEIKNEEWKNIPIPLNDAVTTMKKSILNLESVLVYLCKEQRLKTDSMVKKFRAIEKLIEEKDTQVKRLQASDKKIASDQFSQLKMELDQQEEKRTRKNLALHQKIERVQSEIMRELNYYCQTDFIKDWTQKVVKEALVPYDAKISENHLEVCNKVIQLEHDNLLIPGLIGREEPFRNLKEYVLDQKGKLADEFADVREKMEAQGTSIVEQLQAEQQDGNKEVRQQIQVVK